MIVKDLDLIKKIQIKDFGNFHQRGVVNPLSLWHPLSKLSLTSSSGERWKQLRNLLSPAFKTSNMRMMMSVMNKCCGEFLGVLESKAEQNKSFEARDVFHRLTMDLLVTSAFGIKTDIQKGSGETSMDAILHETQENLLLFRTGWLTFFMSCFPELGFLWKIVLKARSHLLKLPWDNLKDKILPIINLRRSNPNARKEDLLQLMLNAEVDAEATIHVHQLTIPNEDENVAEETTVATSKVPRKKRFLSDADIQSTAVVFLIAGFETTSTSLSFSSYLLAKHQDIQDRLRAEIMSVLHRDGSLNYDNVFGMRYLNQVVQESLRIMPPVIGFTTRKCQKDYHHNGTKIPAGMSLLIPPYHLNNDPHHWREPQTFDPERFAAENKGIIDPMVYQPFGNGPRNCIGMRFAQLEMKLALAKMLAKYRLHLDETHHEKEKLNVTSTFIFLYPEDGVWLKLEKV